MNGGTRFCIKTYGCQMNVRDSEALRAIMLANGYKESESGDDADIVIINSCTVRQKAEEKAIGKAGNMIASKKVTGIMGCAVKRLGNEIFTRLPKLDFAVAPRAFGMIPGILAEGRFPRLELGDDIDSAALSAHVEGGFQAFVTVLLGCDNRCSYCIVPDVRGHEYSRPSKDIIAEVEALAKTGVKEVCLLGQSVLRYGLKTGESFPALLRSLAQIEGIERIRFTSAHPKGVTDELLEVYRDEPKVCRHLHLPVQSGSDRILKEMGRRYTRAEYLEAIAKLRSLGDDFAVTTDVIVGYPGETMEDFEATRSLMEEAGFDNSFVFKYSPRPGTRSALLEDDVAKEEKERRDQVLLEDQEKRGLRRNEKLVGSVREVMFEGLSKRNKDRFSGRDSGNRIVVWPATADRLMPGTLVNIKINSAHPQILIGEAI